MIFNLVHYKYTEYVCITNISTDNVVFHLIAFIKYVPKLNDEWREMCICGISTREGKVNKQNAQSTERAKMYSHKQYIC